MNRRTQGNQRKFRLPKGFKKKSKAAPSKPVITEISVPEENTTSCQTKGCGCGN